MEKAIKLIITEEASEFSQESNATMENYNITPAFCSKDGEELLNRIKAEQPDCSPYGFIYDQTRCNRRNAQCKTR